jgi:hypothetical protein
LQDSLRRTGEKSLNLLQWLSVSSLDSHPIHPQHNSNWHIQTLQIDD